MWNECSIRNPNQNYRPDEKEADKQTILLAGSVDVRGRSRRLEDAQKQSQRPTLLVTATIVRQILPYLHRPNAMQKKAAD
jgi:hypothetical protein|tara:strand:+ start:216 stop:455 length:240 start_codon:yes stop_codon:yes gene_type:complete